MSAFYYWKQFDKNKYYIKIINEFNEVLLEYNQINKIDLNKCILIISSKKAAILNIKNEKWSEISKIKLNEKNIIKLL